MKNIKRITLALSFALYAFGLKAQTEVTAPMTGTPTAGSYFSYSSITLSPGFSFTATAGSSLNLYIQNPDCQQLPNGFSQNRNYILTSIPRTEITNAVGLQNRNTCDLMQKVQYFDGLGRPLQTIQVKGSPLGKDAVQPFVYDQFGRESQKYLPYAAQGTADGSFKSTAISDQGSFYNSPPSGSGVSQINYPLSGTLFEASPLNRVLEQGAPGIPWQLSNSGIAGSGHTVKTVFGTNAATDVPLWSVNAAGNGVSGGSTFYDIGQLYTMTITDENGNNRIEYKDKNERVICKKVQGANSYLSTQYVYDDQGNLSYVLPPLPTGTTYPASIAEGDAVFANFMYGYHYDERDRLVEKKIPGKDWEFTVYNKLDQVVASQDGVQRLKSPQEWMFIKYDPTGRAAYTGIYQYPGSTAGSINRLALQSIVNNQTILWENPLSSGYSGTSWPQSNILDTLTVNYYDDYSFPGNPYQVVAPNALDHPRGMLTATKTKTLSADGSYGPMLWGVHWYDGKGREIQTIKQHYLGGVASRYNYDQMSNSYNNITDELQNITRQHYVKNSNNTASVLGVTVSNTYTYDHAGRRIQNIEQIDNNQKVLLSQMDYNEIGQLVTKHLHGANGAAPFLQDINYTYNERGWLFKINDPSVAVNSKQLFAEQLNYNLPVNGASPRFNGSIAEQIYNAGISGNRVVKYSYDALNRLTDGISTAGFSESNITYDELGNIKTLTRGANTPYTYSYIGNQLQTVAGLTGSTYTYDPNGNMKHDGRNNNDVAYNILDLPRSVTGSATISYVYNAVGDKLRKVSGTTITDYVDGIQYTTTGAGSPNMDFIQTEEGRVNKSGANYIYEYTLTDHLGNNRVTFDQTNGKVSEDDYYPFGMNVHRQQTGVGNKYLYNKKELQDELNQYDYGARFYDPVIARWTSVDPLAEINRRFSPYNYGNNNPIVNIDPDGMASQQIQDFDGNWHTVDDKNLINIFTAPAEKESDEDGCCQTVPTATQSQPKSAMGNNSVVENSLKYDGPPVITGGILSLASYVIYELFTSHDDAGRDLQRVYQIALSKNFRDPQANRGLANELYRNGHRAPAAEEEDGDDQFIYRSGAPSAGNLTPRPGIDDVADNEKRGLSTFTTAAEALIKSPKADMVTKISVKSLHRLGLTTHKKGTHVSIRPATQQELERWAATKPALSTGGNSHIYTKLVQASVRGVAKR
ncbi:DUF6443 domain-containing protein [Mucilaginibacter lappiensis]|uniref:RHS repeat-associated protein n=1 Tax=Mucilaginibacter lappiensis TaxID=354630 RepID=A0A841JFG2_9SPHI|nr:DUF6443 domain-containing protein [Mucilaginibacter lappiensis]MBB6128336.1 RHS repeat-associated protein [Mucilaginibacter lappiensis]